MAPTTQRFPTLIKPNPKMAPMLVFFKHWCFANNMHVFHDLSRLSHLLESKLAHKQKPRKFLQSSSFNAKICLYRNMNTFSILSWAWANGNIITKKNAKFERLPSLGLGKIRAENFINEKANSFKIQENIESCLWCDNLSESSKTWTGTRKSSRKYAQRASKLSLIVSGH